jgi:hypothetical protein
MSLPVEELLNMSEDDLFIALIMELGRSIERGEEGLDALFDTSQLKDEKSWERYRRFRAEIESDYKEIFGDDQQ